MSTKAEKSSGYDHEDIKSSSSKMKQHDGYEEPQDYDISRKKDAPPRFSTIFDTKPQAFLAEPAVEAPRRRRRNGVFIPMPIFVLLAVLFLLESIVLFAYTAIGLYNQLPGRLVATGHGSTAAACDLAAPVEHQAPINISPNFVVGGAGNQVTVTETVTFIGRSPMSEKLPSSTSAVSSSLTTSSSSTSSTVSIPVVTVTPGGGVVTSVVLVTASVESQSSQPRPTVTVIAGASEHSSSIPSVSASAAAKDHTTESTSSTTSTRLLSSSSSSTTSTTQIPSPSTTSTTAAAKGTHMACIGGAGGVMLDCL